jgi:hypothetical protein
MNVREAAEALLDATRECGNMDEITEYCNDLREALAEPEPVTAEAMLDWMKDQCVSIIPQMDAEFIVIDGWLYSPRRKLEKS